jgi:SH3-like domain-containing protein
MAMRTNSFTIFLACGLLLLTSSGTAYGLDYVSVAEPSAILYDAPSLKARKLFLVSRYMPLEQVISLDMWVKVRDSSGSLAWIERRALGNKRYVLVTATLAAIHQAPDENSALLARVQQQVTLEWLEGSGSGWLKVHHQDGVVGYVKTGDVWGG